ncbi:hypothetical protein PISMIDRAFT_143798 [Pisolithus microcarpus 441]|uniref:Uncharacterized protein n=1 Tax=Pisolithus microcarpus 441 TaxID=765257 RepID=A0A0D0A064_9AGAM|nr:hypothetical protein PISMIDRAFT_143798 [Pisolithus microcarpus 441]
MLEFGVLLAYPLQLPRCPPGSSCVVQNFLVIANLVMCIPARTLETKLIIHSSQRVTPLSIGFLFCVTLVPTCRFIRDMIVSCCLLISTGICRLSYHSHLIDF